MRGMTIDVSVNLVTETCCVSSCGILFAVPEDWQRARRRDHTNFYCPNGHHQAYQAKTREEELKAELERARKIAEMERKTAARLQDDKSRLKRQVSAQRGVATRLRNKAIAGECAFCHERFANVAEHVQAEHPSEAPAEEEAADGN